MIDLHGLRKPRAVGLLALGALLFFFAACQLVAGVQSRELDPVASGCSLPGGSGPRVRFANLAPNADVLDVCIRSSGSSWGEPIILNGGSGCATSPNSSPPPFPKGGFTYGEISIPFTAPGAKIDVRTVQAGTTCTSAAVAEIDGVSLQAAPTITTLIAIGGATNLPKKLVALPEFNAANNGEGGLFRFVNTLTAVPSIDVGAASSSQLPTTLSVTYNLAGGIPYGGTLAKGEKVAIGQVYDNGYLNLLGAEYQLAMAPHGQSTADILFPNLEIGNQNVSVYAAGIAFNDTYPLEGFYCEESAPTTSPGNPLLMSCSTSALPTLSFDVWNPALYGPNSPAFQAREGQYQQGPATNPIATRTSDVMCLVEVDTTNDQNNIISVGKGGNFNYSFTIPTTLTTPFSNGGKTQDGGTCPTSVPPACAQLNSTSSGQTAINNAFTCMAQNCSSLPGDMSGFLNTTTDCLASSCMGPLGSILVQSRECFDCVIDGVSSSEPYSGVQHTCTTVSSPPLGFAGQNNSLILSKYPIKATDSYILTSTYYRRTVLYAEVEFPGGLDVDVYCGFFITPLIATDLPYLGCFGGGATTSEDQYLAENLWQANQLTDWVAKKSGKGGSGNPAVIVGDWRVGLGSTTDAGASSTFPPPQGIGEATINFMSGQGGLTIANGQNWPPAGECNNCPGTVNLLNAPNTTSYFSLQPFLYQWPNPTGGNPMLDEQLIFTQDVIAVGDAGTTVNAPISPYYGINFHLLRPPPGTK